MDTPNTPVDAAAADAYLTRAEQECWTIPDVPADTPVAPINKVGVIGAGTMGGGIAMNFASVGTQVVVVEQKQEALDRGLGVVRRNYDNSAAKGRFSTDEAAARADRISGSLNYADLADCDLVIEAVFENMDIKKQVFGQLDGIVKDGAILATNTSFLNVDEIATATARPESVIGMHFFSPANVMKLCEVVRGEKSSNEVIATTMQAARDIDKIGVLVGVGPGFVGNRMLSRRQAQAQELLLDGAMPWDVDRVLTDFGFRMGPFAMSDLAGLDIGWNAETSKGESLRDVLCEAGRRGQKTGAGYYDYDENRLASPSDEVKGLLHDFVARSGRTPRSFSDEEMLQRQLFPMINEGARILDEGKALRASDIDVVWIHGYRWPRETGGPMFYADSVGLTTVVEQLRAFEKEFGSSFAPAPMLVRLAGEGGSFTQ